jgi:hypothetical protein
VGRVEGSDLSPNGADLGSFHDAGGDGQDMIETGRGRLLQLLGSLLRELQEIDVAWCPVSLGKATWSPTATSDR